MYHYYTGVLFQSIKKKKKYVVCLFDDYYKAKSVFIIVLLQSI